MQVESSATPLLTIDEVERIQRKKVATIIGHVFQLTYVAFFDKLVQEKKVNRCYGCTIQHTSQRQHSCLMLDTEDAWFYYHDEAREQIDLEDGGKRLTVESVCSTLGLKLGQTWKSYLTELPKLPWTSLYLTSLELENYDEDMEERVLYALYYGPCGLKTNDFSSVEIRRDDNSGEVMNVDPTDVQCPENVVRKEEKLMDLDNVINEIQKKFYF